METILSLNTVLILFAIFTGIMAVVLYLKKAFNVKSIDGFYVADRKVKSNSAAMSIAVSWIWAPALFIASSIAFDLGIAGALWFIIPNIVCFFVFAPLAVKFRESLPNGYSIPEYFRHRYPKKESVSIAFSITTTLFALAAIIENLVAISKLFQFYTGFSGVYAILFMTLIALSYSLISGLKASIFTDVFQMSVVVLIGLVLVPWSLSSISGDGMMLSTIVSSAGSEAWLAIAFAPGLSLLFGLIGGPLGDQMFFQRAMSVPKKAIRKTLYKAGLLFAIVPIALSLFGFIGRALKDQIVVADSELVGAVIIAEYLPPIASILFFFMMICGLASTLDSAYCAGSSVFGRELFRIKGGSLTPKKEIRLSRYFMVFFAIFGALLASFSRDIWYVFMTDAAIAASGIVPILLSAFWKKQTANATFWALILGLIVGCSTSIAGHFFDAQTLAALGAPLAVVVGLFVSLILNQFSTNLRHS